jgi:hypothetical protein
MRCTTEPDENYVTVDDDLLFSRDPERILLLNDLPALKHFPTKFVAASAPRERLQNCVVVCRHPLKNISRTT